MAPMWEAQNRRLYNATVYRTPSTDIYFRHNDYVRKLVPKDRLLEFEPGTGWKPLCDILGRDIPKDQAYPGLFVKTENRKWFLIGAALGCGF